MVAADRVTRPDQYSSAIPAYVDDEMASDSDAFHDSPYVEEHDPHCEQDTGGAFTAVHYPATLASQNEVMIQCAQSPSPRTSTGMLVELNESEDESKETGKRKGKYCLLCPIEHVVDKICIIAKIRKTSTIPIDL